MAEVEREMSGRLTPTQFRTLNFIASGGGMTCLLSIFWRNRHHQTLVRRGFLRLRADPFKTKADMLRGRITARGMKAVLAVSPAVRARADADDDRDYAKHIRDLEGGGS